jgi:hypothetical protein
VKPDLIEHDGRKTPTGVGAAVRLVPAAKATWALLLPLAVAGGQESKREEPKKSPAARSVKDQVLTSTEAPTVKLKFDKNFKYVDSQSFILYDVARAEQHFFVDANEKGQIARMYWIQFEGYLPTNTHTYRYKATKTVKIGGLEFIADAWARNIKDSPGRPDSDGSRAREFLEKKGFRLASDDVLSQRLVHLVDEKKRDELMIIYMEDLSAMKRTAKDLAKDGRAAGEWDEIAKALLDRAVKGMEISR